MTDAKMSASVYRQIRGLIVDGTYQHGYRLVEGDLMQALACGRSYVREALLRLEYDGLVEKQTGRSSTVRFIPKAELIEILEARIALEAVMVRSAAACRTAEQAVRFRDLLSALERHVDATDVVGAMAAQAAFHHAVLDAGRLPATRRIIANLSALSAQTRSRTMLLPGRLASSAREHRAIAVALVSGDEDAAERAMVKHLESVKSAVIQMPNAPARGIRRAASGEQTRRTA